MRASFLSAVMLAMSAITSHADVPLEPYSLKGPNGAVVAAEIGTLMLPENRANPSSRKIAVRFVRVRASGDAHGPPIVYLAGGPGGSAVGAFQGKRFAFFMRLREAGDVVLFEQRGTGLSDALPVCNATMMDPTRPMDRANFAETYRRELKRCIGFWSASGADVAGYNTTQSVADLEDLRKALGVEQLNLLGISYGTHFGMAALKAGLPVHRVVLTGLEGLDQTVKLPAHFDAFFARVAELVRKDPAVAAAYPDLLGLMRRVHARLEREPAAIMVEVNGARTQVRLGSFAIQLLTSFLLISDPEKIAKLPGLYAMMDAGDFSVAGRTIYGALAEFSKMRGMPELMDLASGISPGRLTLALEQARSAIIGDAGNSPMPQIQDIAPALTLPASYRSPLSTKVPTLLIMSTLDGRTPVESQSELLPQFLNATRLTVINGGHNIFEQSEDVQREIVRFFKQGDTGTREIALPPPVFAK
jgi:pimeloyl-ACP methyl ester carboxylesterase